MATTAFRLAAASAAGFILIATLIIGALFWQTNELLTEQVISGLRAEVAELTRDSASEACRSLRKGEGPQPPGGAAALFPRPARRRQDRRQSQPHAAGAGGKPAGRRVSLRERRQRQIASRRRHSGRRRAWRAPRHRTRHRGSAQLRGAHRSGRSCGRSVSFRWRRWVSV